MFNTCSRRSIAVAIVVLVAAAAWLRLWNLELRPPHHDEGVNGWFTENILRDGYYKYDPENYHGPLYFYLIAGARKLLGFGLWELRLPGVLIGIAACFVPLVIRRRIGWPAALAACAVLATSPTLVYYARYAIHETLLAAFGLLAAACTLRWADRGHVGWLVGVAACLGGMIATKETTVLFVAPAGLWLVGESIVETVQQRRFVVLGNRWTGWPRVLVVAAAVLGVIATIHVLAFTAAFKAPGSLGEQLYRSIHSYFVWSETGTGHSGHVKPACYYIHLATRYELVLYALAIVGLIDGFRQRIIRGTGVVGLGMMLVYSLIPYKMPWLPASWLALLAIPAGHGVAVLGRVLGDEIAPRLRKAAIVVAILPALAITMRSSFVRPADPREDLAYVPTLPGYNTCMALVELGAARVGREALTIGFTHPAQWPFAWSLMPYPGTRWFVAGDEDIVIVGASQSTQIEAKLRGSYTRRRLALHGAAEPAAIYLKRSIYEPHPRGR
jgi:uncharacterized protein (TIGR03663 family)